MTRVYADPNPRLVCRTVNQKLQVFKALSKRHTSSCTILEYKHDVCCFFDGVIDRIDDMLKASHSMFLNCVLVFWWRRRRTRASESEKNKKSSSSLKVVIFDPESITSPRLVEKDLICLLSLFRVRISKINQICRVRNHMLCLELCFLTGLFELCDLSFC